MKEFKLRFTADVADIEAQFKGAASELKKFAAGVASAENQLEALQQTGAYLAQMDKQLSELKKKYPDIFNKIFGNVDAQVKAALEPLMKSPKLVSKAVNMIGNQLSGISTGKLDATNTEMKKLGETVQTLAKTMGMQADLDFLNGTDKARLKAQKLIDVLANLSVAYYKLDKASDRTDIGKITAREDAANAKASKATKTKATKDKSVNKPAMAYDDLYKLVQESKELSKKIDEGDDSAFDSLDKKINKIAKAFKLSEDGIAQLDMMLQDTDQTVEETMGKLQKLLGEKFPQQVQTSDLESGFDKIEDSAENTTQKMKEAADAARLKAEEDEKARLSAEAEAKASQEAADAAERKAQAEERARDAAIKLDEASKNQSKRTENALFYDSKTGKSSDVITGENNNVSFNWSKYKNLQYDTEMHSHPFDVAAPSVEDFDVWINNFNDFKKFAIRANKEILSLDFSSLDSDGLKGIRDKYAEMVSNIEKEFMANKPDNILEPGAYEKWQNDFQAAMKNALTGIISPDMFSTIDFQKVVEPIKNSKISIPLAEEYKNATEEVRNLVNELAKLDDLDETDEIAAKWNRLAEIAPNVYKSMRGDEWEQLKQQILEVTSVAENAKTVIGSEGTGIPIEDSGAEKEKEIAQELITLKEKLNSIPTNPVDATELDIAQKEVKSLQEEVLRLEGALDSWKSGYYDMQESLDRSVPISELDNMTPNDVVDSYRSKIEQLSNEVADLTNKLAQAQSTSETGVDNSAEVAMYEALKQKLIEVTAEINAKTEAFKNEGTVVDTSVGAEIEKLEELRKKIENISNLVTSIGEVNIVTNTDQSKPTPLEGEPLKGEQTSINIDGTIRGAKEHAAAEEQVNDALDNQITKKKELKTLDSNKEKLSKSIQDFQSKLNMDFVSQDSVQKLDSMKQRLDAVTNGDELNAWKQDWNNVSKSIGQAAKEQEGLALSSQKTKLSGMKKSITDAYKGAAIDIDKATDEQKVFAQSYDELSSKLTFYAKNRRVLSNDEMAALEKEAKAIKEKANAYAKQADEQKKAENAYGTKEIKTAQSKKEKITGVATSDKFSDSQKVTSKLADMNAAYDALIAKQKEFKPGQETEDDRIAFQKLANDFNKAYQELSELINESERLSKNSNWSKSLNPDFDISTYDGMRSALEDAVRSTEIGKVKIDDFNFSLRQLDYSVQNQDGSWSHFTAKLNATGTEIVGVNAKLKQTDNIFKRLFSGASNKFMQALTRFTGFDAFYKGINEVRKGIQYVKEIDLALTELKKVTDETEDTYANFLQTASKTSAVIGSTIADFTNATADFARLGYSISEATELAKAASVYKNVGDGIDSVEQATESIISTMKAFGIEADNSMAIVDKFNEVGK